MGVTVHRTVPGTSDRMGKRGLEAGRARGLTGALEGSVGPAETDPDGKRA